jgi:hypothetical protein
MYLSGDSHVRIVFEAGKIRDRYERGDEKRNFC